MKKILWISDYSFSGYTLVTNCLLKYITEYYDVYLLIINTSSPRDVLVKRVNTTLGLTEDHIFNVQRVDKITPDNVKILIGIHEIPDILKNINPDIIFSLNDLHILVAQIKCIKKYTFWKGITIAYIPIDAENYPKYMFTELNEFTHVITMNNASKKILLNSEFYKPLYILNHPIKNTYYQLKHKSLLRKMLGNQINDECILIFNANVNAKRKRLDLTIESFYILYNKYHNNIKIQAKNVFLVLKTSVKGDFNIQQLITDFNIKYNIQLENNILIIDNKLSYEDLNSLYNCADLYISTTSGEGWGLTAFEFLKLNIYTLVPSNISYIEFFNEELLYNTQPTSLAQGRILLKFQDNFMSRLLLGTKSSKFNITRSETVQIDGHLDNIYNLIISPDSSEFNSFNSAINNLKNLSDNNRLPDKFQIYIKIRKDISYTFYEKIMTEIYHYDFNNFKIFAPLYNIHCAYHTGLDSSIVQVKLPNMDNLVDKIIYYIRNKELCDKKIQLYSAKILKNLSDKKIGEKFINIMKDIIME